MAERILQLTIDTTQAKVNLDQLGLAFDRAASGASAFKSAVSSGLSNVDRNMTNLAGGVQKLAAASKNLNSVNISAALPTRLAEFAKAMDALGAAKTISQAKVTSIAQFAKAVANLKPPAGNFNGLIGMLNSLANVKVPTSSQITRLKEFFVTLGTIGGGKSISSAQLRSVTELTTALGALSNFNPPSAAKIARIKLLFDTLASLKAIPNAGGIAQSLNTVGAAAQRASNGFAGLPPRILSSGEAARKTSPHMVRLGSDLHGLSARFSLAYQSGSLFGTLFSAFTLGSFVKHIYDANIELMKLQKGLIFATGSLSGAKHATDEFIGMAIDLGLDIGKTTDAYNRFVISSRASGIALDQSNSIFRSVSTALQVVGANSEQATLAFYGLTQMMQKGKVVSEEFNRQLGEQIPGNAVFGAQALSIITGKTQTVASFFKTMSKGMIPSDKFVPVWAEMLKKSFEPLMDVARQRPDVALTQLKDSFVVFSQAVGKSGFMGALTKEFRSLREQIVTIDKDGIAHLTPAAERLAKSLGQNLSMLVHGVASALKWMAQNIDLVITAGKIFIGLMFAKTIMDITAKVGTSTDAIAKMVQGIQSWTKAQLGLNAAQKANNFAVTGQTAAALGPSAPMVFGKGGKATVIREVTPAATSAADFIGSAVLGGGLGASAGKMAAEAEAKVAMGTVSKVLTGGAPQVTSAGRALKTAFEVAGAGATTLAVTAKKSMFSVDLLGGALKGLAVGLRAVGVAFAFLQAPLILVGGWIALMILFKDKVTEASNSLDKMGKKTTTLGDELSVGMGALVKSISDSLGGPPKDYEIGWKGFFDFLGQGFLGLVAYIQAIASMIVHIPDDVNKAGQAVGLNLRGRHQEAAALSAEIDSHYDPHLPQKFYEKLAGEASDRYNARVGTAGGDAAATAMAEKAAEQVAALQAQNDLLRKQAEMDDMARRSGVLGFDIPSFEEQKRMIAEADKGASEAAKISAQAAQTAADAAKTARGTPITGTVPTGDLKLPTGATGAQIMTAINTASQVYGISPEFMTRYIAKESGFRADARPRDKDGKPVGTAYGYGQIIDDTAKRYGLLEKGVDGRTDINRVTLALGQIMRENTAILEKTLKRPPTAGESYAAMFLGAGSAKSPGAAQLYQAIQQNPNANAAQLFPRAAKANGSIFYEDFAHKGTSAPRSVSQVATVFDRTMGQSVNGPGAFATTGSPLAPLSSGDEAKQQQAFEDLKAGLAAKEAFESPSQAAKSAQTKLLAAIDKARKAKETLRADGFDVSKLLTVEDVDKMQKASQRKVDDSVNPFTKEAREMRQANDVVAMRLNGLTDEADFQEKLNKLMEQGEDITKLNTKSNLELIQTEKDRADALKLQSDILKHLNDATLSRISRTASPFQSALASRVPIEEGKTYEEALSDLAKLTDSKGVSMLDRLKQSVTVDLKEKAAAATQNIGESLAELSANVHLNSTARQWRDDYKKFLQDLTGSTHDSLTAIEGDAQKGQIALAQGWATIKQQLENPPGFQRWADALEPVQKRLEDIKAGFMDTLSNAITDAMTGTKVDFKAIMKDLTKQTLKVYVDEALKGVVNMFGGKKAADVATTPEGRSLQKAGGDVSVAASSLDHTATKWDAVGDKWSTVADHLMQVGAGGGAGGGGSGIASSISQGIEPLTALVQSIQGTSVQTNVPDLVSTTSSMAGIAQALGLNSSPAISDTGFSPAVKQPDGSSLLDELLVTATKKPAMDIIPTSNLISPTTNVPGLQTMSQMLGDMSGFKSAGATAAAGGKGGFWSSFGQSLIPLAMSGISALLNQKKKTKPPKYPQQYVHGIIGEMRDITTTGREIAGHSNPIGDILSAVASMAMSAFSNAGGFSGGGMSSIGSGFSKFASMFSHFPGFAEGGYSTSPVSFSRMPSWRSIPHYAEGTSNTSGFMAVLHPNEAVIPLSRGRSIPVDLGDHHGGGGVYVHAPMTVITQNADSFRSSQSSIERKQSSALRRTAARNLT